MATRYAVATGNWSNTATWDGGTLPTAADDVHANNKTITLDQNIDVLSLRTTAGGAAVAGGNFNTPTSGTRTIDANIIAGSSSVVQILGTCNCTITGNVTGSATTSNTSAVYIARTGASYLLADLPVATIIGNVIGGSTATAEGVRLNGGTLTITGSLTGGTAGNGCRGLTLYNSENQPWDVTINNGPVTGGSSSANDAQAIQTQSAQTGTARTQTILRVNGNVVGGTAGSRNYGVDTGSGHTITVLITGNITSNSALGFYCRTIDPATIVGNLQASNVSCVQAESSAGTITVTGNITGGSANNSWGLVIYNGINTIINGNVYGGTAGSEPYGVSHNGNGSITINGNVYGGTGGSSPGGLRHSSAATVTINGSVYGATSGSAVNPVGAYNSGVGIMTINGSAVAGTITGASGAVNQSTGTLFAKRAVANAYGPGSVGIGVAYGVASNLQGSVTRVEELEFGIRGMIPIIGPGQVTLVSETTNKVDFLTSTGTRKVLVDGNASGLMPAVTDVRSGVSYNGGSLTGTCAVPAANSVAAGVPVDNTVGTAALTPASVWDYALSSASSTSGSVGEKLKKTAIPADIIALG